MKVCLFPQIVLLVFLTNCNHPKKPFTKKEKLSAKPIFFDPIELGATNKTSNLSIEARFSECGEWGGHREKITLFADSNMNIHARYQVYPYSCDSLQFYYGNKSLNPVVDKTITVGDNEKVSVTEYIQRITQAKVAERFPGNAGDVFSVVKSDSTFFIRVYDNKESNVNDYRRLVRELFN